MDEPTWVLVPLGAQTAGRPEVWRAECKTAVAGSPPASALAQADWQPHRGSQVQRKQEKAAGTMSVRGQGHSHHTPSIL